MALDPDDYWSRHYLGELLFIETDRHWEGWRLLSQACRGLVKERLVPAWLRRRFPKVLGLDKDRVARGLAEAPPPP